MRNDLCRAVEAARVKKDHGQEAVGLQKMQRVPKEPRTQ
jgi:hypothetical protein